MTRVVAGAVAALAFLVAGCGGGSDESNGAPSRASIESCFEHSGAGSRVFSAERRAAIGGLPAHVEITSLGFEGDLGGTVGIFLFKDSEEAEKGESILEEEYASGLVDAYADGTVVGVATGGDDTAKDEAILEECAEGGEGTLVDVERKERREAIEEEREDEIAQSPTGVPTAEEAASCLEEGGLSVEAHERAGYTEVLGEGKDGDLVGIYLLTSFRPAETMSEVKAELEKERPGAIATASEFDRGGAVVAAVGTSAASPLATEADEGLAHECASAR